MQLSGPYTPLYLLFLYPVCLSLCFMGEEFLTLQKRSVFIQTIHYFHPVHGSEMFSRCFLHRPLGVGGILMYVQVTISVLGEESSSAPK